MQAKTALGQRRQADHPHVWGGGHPSQPSLRLLCCLPWADSGRGAPATATQTARPRRRRGPPAGGRGAEEQRPEGPSPTARERRPPASVAAFLKVSLLPKSPSTLLFLSLQPLLFPLAQLTPVICWFPQDIVQHPCFCSLPPFYYYFFSPLRHFICVYYIPRKRIRGFSLLYVFLLLLHGP